MRMKSFFLLTLWDNRGRDRWLDDEQSRPCRPWWGVHCLNDCGCLWRSSNAPPSGIQPERSIKRLTQQMLYPLFNKHTKTWTKWPTYFQMHFLDINVYTINVYMHDRVLFSWSGTTKNNTFSCRNIFVWFISVTQMNALKIALWI